MKKIKQKQIDDILSAHFWPEKLTTRRHYITTHDDNNGAPESGFLMVSFTADGDAWIGINGSPILRFRMMDGGGKYLKTRNALLLLAEAMRQEGDEEWAKRWNKFEKEREKLQRHIQ